MGDTAQLRTQIGALKAENTRLRHNDQSKAIALGRLESWLLTLPDAHISDEARRDGLAVLRGEPRPGTRIGAEVPAQEPLQDRHPNR